MKQSWVCNNFLHYVLSPYWLLHNPYTLDHVVHITDLLLLSKTIPSEFRSLYTTILENTSTFYIDSNVWSHNSQSKCLRGCCHGQVHEKRFRLYILPCHNCNIISLPSTDVISAKVATCRYSLQSIRRRTSLSVGLDKRKYCITNIFLCRCLCNCGNESCIRISLSPKSDKCVIQVEVRVLFNWSHGTYLNIPGNPISKPNCSAEAVSNVTAGVLLAIPF